MNIQTYFVGTNENRLLQRRGPVKRFFDKRKNYSSEQSQQSGNREQQKKGNDYIHRKRHPGEVAKKMQERYKKEVDKLTKKLEEITPDNPSVATRFQQQYAQVQKRLERLYGRERANAASYEALMREAEDVIMGLEKVVESRAAMPANERFEYRMQRYWEGKIYENGKVVSERVLRNGKRAEHYIDVPEDWVVVFHNGSFLKDATAGHSGEEVAMTDGVKRSKALDKSMGRKRVFFHGPRKLQNGQWQYPDLTFKVPQYDAAGNRTGYKEHPVKAADGVMRYDRETGELHFMLAEIIPDPPAKPAESNEDMVNRETYHLKPHIDDEKSEKHLMMGDTAIYNGKVINSEPVMEDHFQCFVKDGELNIIAPKGVAGNGVETKTITITEKNDEGENIVTEEITVMIYHPPDTSPSDRDSDNEELPDPNDLFGPPPNTSSQTDESQDDNMNESDDEEIDTNEEQTDESATDDMGQTDSGDDEEVASNEEETDETATPDTDEFQPLEDIEPLGDMEGIVDVDVDIQPQEIEISRQDTGEDTVVQRPDASRIEEMIAEDAEKRDLRAQTIQELIAAISSGDQMKIPRCGEIVDAVNNGDMGSVKAYWTEVLVQIIDTDAFNKIDNWLKYNEEDEQLMPQWDRAKENSESTESYVDTTEQTEEGYIGEIEISPEMQRSLAITQLATSMSQYNDSKLPAMQDIVDKVNNGDFGSAEQFWDELNTRVAGRFDVEDFVDFNDGVLEPEWDAQYVANIRAQQNGVGESQWVSLEPDTNEAAEDVEAEPSAAMQEMKLAIEEARDKYGRSDIQVDLEGAQGIKITRTTDGASVMYNMEGPDAYKVQSIDYAGSVRRYNQDIDGINKRMSQQIDPFMTASSGGFDWDNLEPKPLVNRSEFLYGVACPYGMPPLENVDQVVAAEEVKSEETVEVAAQQPSDSSDSTESTSDDEPVDPFADYDPFANSETTTDPFTSQQPDTEPSDQSARVDVTDNGKTFYTSYRSAEVAEQKELTKYDRIEIIKNATTFRKMLLADDFDLEDVGYSDEPNMTQGMQAKMRALVDEGFPEIQLKLNEDGTGIENARLTVNDVFLNDGKINDVLGKYLAENTETELTTMVLQTLQSELAAVLTEKFETDQTRQLDALVKDNTFEVASLTLLQDYEYADHLKSGTKALLMERCGTNYIPALTINLDQDAKKVKRVYIDELSSMYWADTPMATLESDLKSASEKGELTNEKLKEFQIAMIQAINETIRTDKSDALSALVGSSEFEVVLDETDERGKAIDLVDYKYEKNLSPDARAGFISVATEHGEGDAPGMHVQLEYNEEGKPVAIEDVSFDGYPPEKWPKDSKMHDAVKAAKRETTLGQGALERLRSGMAAAIIVDHSK